MSVISFHKKRIVEHLQELQEAIDIGIENRPATIGFHTSACATELLELFLHKEALIPTGKIVKHTWFKRPKPGQKILPLIERKLPVQFENKEKIYELIYTIEENRDNLIYGKISKDQILLVLEVFNKLKEIFIRKLEEMGEELE